MLLLIFLLFSLCCIRKKKIFFCREWEKGQILNLLSQKNKFHSWALSDWHKYIQIHFCVYICAVQILKGIVYICIDNVDSNNINNKKNHKNRIRKRSTTGNDSVKKWMENILKKNLLRIVHSQYGVNDFLLHCINQLLKWTHTCVHFQLLQFNSI